MTAWLKVLCMCKRKQKSSFIVPISVGTVETIQENMMIDFKKFNKEELLVAIDEMVQVIKKFDNANKVSAMPIFNKHILAKLYIAKHNRLARKNNSLTSKINALHKPKLSKTETEKLDMLFRQLISVKKQIEENGKKLLEFKIITQKEYDELPIKHW